MSSEGRPRFLVVGHVNKPHGRKGEVFVWSLTDYPASHFSPGVLHRTGDGERPSAAAESLAVESARPFRKGFLIRFEGVDDRDAAEALRGRYLHRPFEAMDEPADGEFFYHELLGAAVETRAGEPLGEVREVYALEPNHLLRVAGRGGEVLVPFVARCVVEVDREKRRIVVDLPEGLAP